MPVNVYCGGFAMPSLATIDVQSSTFAAQLLDRAAPVVYDDDARRLVRGSRVLVTGAAGSIGSELSRQIHSLEPAALFLLDHDESGMHSVQLDLHGHGLFEDDSVVLCDIRDSDAVRAAIDRTAPDIVFHAAAHKHLPLLERYPAEGVKTNVFGTLNLVRAAAHAGVRRFVNVSTDKAASPTSVLGATKRLAELVVAAAASGPMRVASVRFGNVLGSRGSLLQSLHAQVRNGREITITHPDVSRYFMTIPEAAGLVIEAAVLAELGETYVLDMGDPVLIVDLVARYLELVERPDYPIVFTGLRPGEKMHESLFDSAESGTPTPHKRISAVRQQSDMAARILSSIESLRAVVSDAYHDRVAVRSLLVSLLPENADRFTHPAMPVSAMLQHTLQAV